MLGQWDIADSLMEVRKEKLEKLDASLYAERDTLLALLRRVPKDDYFENIFINLFTHLIERNGLIFSQNDEVVSVCVCVGVGVGVGV
jgi:hypothetical protein